MDYSILICFYWSPHSEEGCNDSHKHEDTYCKSHEQAEDPLPSDVGVPKIILRMMFWHPELTIALTTLMICVLLNQLSLIHTQIMHFLLNNDEKLNILFGRGRGQGSQLTRG